MQGVTRFFKESVVNLPIKPAGRYNARMSKPATLVTLLVVGLLAGMGIYLFRAFQPTASRGMDVRSWITSGQSDPEALLHAGERCGDAPFLYPTDGLIGFLW